MEAIRMSVEGSVQVAVDWHDSADTTNLDTLKKIRLSKNDTYSGTKVAIVTGTCGTAASTFAWTSCGYVAADGSTVSFLNENSVDGIAFVADPYGVLTVGDPALSKGFKICSEDSGVAMSQPARRVGETIGGLAISVFVDSSRSQTTAAFAFVMWGN
jgi:hypothetical protein